MNDDEVEIWKGRIEVVHRKVGRTLTTAILHVAGDEPPPPEALLLATGNWEMITPGQIARRPDEWGKQVYWVNVLNS